jgi:hypothetical protein
VRVPAPHPETARPPTYPYRLAPRRTAAVGAWVGVWDDEADARAASEGTLAAWRPARGENCRCPLALGGDGPVSGTVVWCQPDAWFPVARSLPSCLSRPAGRGTGTGASACAVPALSASSRRERPGSAERTCRASGLMIPRPVPFHSLPRHVITPLGQAAVITEFASSAVAVTVA